MNAPDTPPDAYVSQRNALVDTFGDHAPPVTNLRVLEAARSVPRHRFVPDDQRHLAYRDEPLPIGDRQTISQPSLVAYMTELLALEADHRVLEIGTGSGYQAAILAEIVAEVYTIEIIARLGEQSRQLLDELGYGNVRVRIGDGYQGWAEAAPFDAIIVTCAPDAIPQPLVDQLVEGGRMVIPIGEAGQIQELVLLQKQEGVVQRQEVLSVRFVPMTGEAGQP